jgi:Putative beta barrel porin-7 (BBP7)
MFAYRCHLLSLGLFLAAVAPAAAQETTLLPGRVPPTAPPARQLDACACPEPTCLDRLMRCPGDPQHWWVSAENVFGWISGANSPPLLVAAPVGGTTSSLLFGSGDLNSGLRNGFQIRGGFWLNECGTCGLEAGMLYLPGLAERARVGDTPGTIIARPFINALTGGPDAELVSVPGALSGRAAIDAVSSDFWAADVALRKLICCDCRGRLDCLVGYRFLSYGDAVHINEDLSPTTAPFPPGTRITVSDSFTTENRFHGMLFALAGECRRGDWYVQGRGGFSVGGTYRTATISGTTTIQVPPGAPVVLPGGLLALSTNSGTHSESDWMIVPEATVRIGRQVGEHIRVFVGYTFLYWPGVYRAAEQIDPIVNPNLLPPPILPLTGPIRPVFPDRQSSLFLHGLSIGVEVRY